MIKFFMGLLIIILAGFAIYYNYQCRQVAEKIKITTPDGVETLESITLGGVRQWIYIRGENKNNPILLFLHGGPGNPDMALSPFYQREIEKYFVVVRWDQRGAGKSYALSLPAASMTVEQFMADTVELTHYLAKRFNQPKIFIVGHSWGSMLGLLLAQQHPELFYAYVGTGQAANLPEQEKRSYQFALDEARRHNHTSALAELQKIGPPPYANAEEHFEGVKTLQNWVVYFGGELYGQKNYNSILKDFYFSPIYSFKEKIFNYFFGILSSAKNMLEQISQFNFFKTIPEIKIPVLILQGRHDHNTDAQLAKEYFDQLIAPHKEWVWFEQSAHSPIYEENEKFQQTLIKELPKYVK